MSEEFENEKTGEKVEGITIMADGILKEFVNIIQEKTKSILLLFLLYRMHL